MLCTNICKVELVPSIINRYQGFNDKHKVKNSTHIVNLVFAECLHYPPERDSVSNPGTAHAAALKPIFLSSLGCCLNETFFPLMKCLALYYHLVIEGSLKVMYLQVIVLRNYHHPAKLAVSG